MSNRTSPRRVGIQMRRALEFVAANPGCTQQRVALAIGPNGSHAFGARAVQRALSAGLIANRSTSPCRYELYPAA